MDYKSQYLDPRWQKKRLEIMERDNFKCAWCCDDESTLHVHHRYYKKNAKVWDYDNSILITLCETCHKTYHDSTSNFNADRYHYICNKISEMRDGMSSEYADKYYMYLCRINYDDLYYVPFWWTNKLDENDIEEYGFNIIDLLESAICNNIKVKNFSSYILSCLSVGKLMTAKEVAKEDNEIRMYLSEVNNG